MFLYKILVGCKPKGRHTEQHDIFFGIAAELKDIVPQLKSFWPEAASSMHLDAIRKVQHVGDYSLTIVSRSANTTSDAKLFFINLGGYKPQDFEEYHYKMLIAAQSKAEAIQIAKQSAFYKHTGFAGAPSHIDDKYGIDVDDAYDVEDLLEPSLKEAWQLVLQKNETIASEDHYMLGYHILKKIEAGVYETD
jgi:hypothetical protein